MLLQCREKTLDLTQPKVMGILNLTPDSFFDGGKHNVTYLQQVEKMLQEGAAIIDIGGMSSRPGAAIIPPEEEIERIAVPLENILLHFPKAIISVDTVHAATADIVLQCGAHIVNDISGGTYDKQMFAVVAKHKAAMCLMHMKGAPDTMQIAPEYEYVTNEVFAFLEQQITIALSFGISQLIADVGFGFGKTVEQNYMLLRTLHHFKKLNVPLLCGVSRKSMINKVLNVQAKEALNGTTALHMLCLINGANLLRVHDVKEAVECIEIFNAYYQ